MAPKVERPVFHRDLGEVFVKCRTAKGWSVQRAVIAARGRKHATLTANKLRWLEEGKTKAPDQEVLRAVADIYGLEYRELARAFIAGNYGSDVVLHGDHLGSRSGGVADVPASARRLAHVESELVDLKARFAEVQQLARTLFRIAVTGEEGRAAPRGATRRGRSSGTTG